MEEKIPCNDKVAQRVKDSQTQIEAVQSALNNFLTGVVIAMGIDPDKYEYNLESNSMVLKKEIKEDGKTKTVNPT